MSLGVVLLKKTRIALAKSDKEVMTTKEFNLIINTKIRFDKYDSKLILKNLIRRGIVIRKRDGSIIIC